MWCYTVQKTPHVTNKINVGGNCVSYMKYHLCYIIIVKICILLHIIFPVYNGHFSFVQLLLFACIYNTIFM